MKNKGASPLKNIGPSPMKNKGASPMKNKGPKASSPKNAANDAKVMKFSWKILVFRKFYLISEKSFTWKKYWQKVREK